MVVFAEQTPAKDQSCGKFIVSKIFVHIFQGSCESKGTVDKVMFAQENSLVTVSYKEGINVTEVRVPKTQPKLPIPAFNGFQLVG